MKKDLPYASFRELCQIEDAVKVLYSKSKAPQMKYASVETAINNIRYLWEHDSVYVTGNYAIVAVVGDIWYSSKVFLMEQLVIKFRTDFDNELEHSCVDSVPRLLERIAMHEGCVAVISGDAQRGLMEPVYTRAGFVPVGRQFIKDV